MSKLGAGIESEFDPSPVLRRLSIPDKQQCQSDLLGLAWADSQTLWTIEEGGRFVTWKIQEKDPVPQKEVDLDDPALTWRLDPLLGMGFAASDDLCAFALPTGKPLWTANQPGWISALTSGTVQMAGKQPRPVVVAGHDDGSISLLRPKDGAPIPVKPFPPSRVKSAISAIGISPSQTLIAVADEKRSIWVLNLESETWFELTKDEASVHKNRIVSLEWFPDADGEPTLFSASWDGTVRIWNLDKRQAKMLLNAHGNQVLAMGYAARSHGKPPRFLSSDDGASLYLWDCANWDLLGLPLEIASAARMVAVSPLGNHFAWADTRAVHVSSIEALEQSSSEILGYDPVDPRSLRNDLGFDPSTGSVIHRQSSGEIRSIDHEGKESAPLDFPGQTASAMAVPPAGNWIWLTVDRLNAEGPEAATGGAVSRSLGLQKDAAGQWQVAQVIESAIEPVTSMAIAPDGSRIALASHLTDAVEIWETPSGVPQRILGEGWAGQTVQALAWGKNGELAVGTIDPMATGGAPGHTYLWSQSGCRMVDRIPARIMAWDPTGNLLGRIDHLGRAWILRVGAKIADFALLGESSGAWQAMAFAPHSHCLALGGATQVSLFDWKRDKWLGSVEVPSAVRALWFDGSAEKLWVALKSDECILVSMEPWLPEIEEPEDGPTP